MKKDNRMVQMAFEYAPYRMASSYFEEKPICRSEWMEGKLYFHYQMTKEKEQYQLEDACIRYLEQELWDSVPKELWQASGGEAKLTRRCGANYTEPLFRNQDVFEPCGCNPLYSSAIPCSRAIFTVSSGQREACTSPI